MKLTADANSRWRMMTWFAMCVGSGLLFCSLLTALALHGGISRKAAETRETLSVVAWYLENGYWREDVKAYLMHA